MCSSSVRVPHPFHPAARFAGIIDLLCRTVAARIAGGRLAGPLIILIWVAAAPPGCPLRCPRRPARSRQAPARSLPSAPAPPSGSAAPATAAVAAGSCLAGAAGAGERGGGVAVAVSAGASRRWPRCSPPRRRPAASCARCAGCWGCARPLSSRLPPPASRPTTPRRAAGGLPPSSPAPPAPPPRPRRTAPAPKLPLRACGPPGVGV